MKQSVRLFTEPKTFFNQLQWSTHHWIILITFLSLAVVETQVGRQQAAYQAYAAWLQAAWGLPLGQALWVITFVKLAALVAGAWVVTFALWAVGSLFGRESSRRVLSRRLAVVFTVFLAGYTAGHFGDAYPTLGFASLVLFLWGVILGYHAIRQQFALTHLESVVVGVFAALLVMGGWQVTNNAVESFARDQIASRPTLKSSLARPR